MKFAISIREARSSDAEAMLALLRPIIEGGDRTSLQELPSMQQQREFIGRFPESGSFAVAEDDTGLLLGMQDIVIDHRVTTNSEIEVDSRGSGGSIRTAEISTFVAIGQQRVGIGTLLWNHTHACAQQLGIERILAKVRLSNLDAQRFYRSLGFVEVESRARTEDAVDVRLTYLFAVIWGLGIALGLSDLVPSA